VPHPRLYKTEAIVLRQRRLGEADRILTLATPTYGKLDAKAKGVRKIKSRMGGHLQPLTRCMVQLARGRSLDVVAGCQALETFPQLRDNLERLGHALYAAELADRFLQEGAESQAVYQLLLQTLRRLSEVSVGPELPLRFFEMRLLGQTGFRPQLERCVGCQRSLAEENAFFAPVEGGVLCPSCAQGLSGPRPLSIAAGKALRLLQSGSYDAVGQAPLEAEIALEVERHLRSYTASVLERDIKAGGFLERLRHERAVTRPEG